MVTSATPAGGQHADDLRRLPYPHWSDEHQAAATHLALKIQRAARTMGEPLGPGQLAAVGQAAYLAQLEAVSAARGGS